MTEPNYALICIDADKFLVEKFDPKMHLTVHGWSKANISLFTEMSEVAHLRHLIVN